MHLRNLAIAGAALALTAIAAPPEAQDPINVDSTIYNLKMSNERVRAFIDTGATWNEGEAARRSQWDRGAGAGVFFTATIFTASLDVAWPDTGRPRWHVGLGARF